MAQPFIGEIRMFGGNFAPQNWAFCDGQSLPIAEYEALYTLIGTTYGGDGVQTFNLPDLRGRLPMHVGGSFVQGQMAGTETLTLALAQLPAHTHTVAAKTSADKTTPGANSYGGNTAVAVYTANAPSTSMNPNVVGLNNGGQAHDNMMPFLAVSFIIALFGVFPSRN